MLEWSKPVADFLYASVLAGTPLLLGTLGEIVTEKSGHLNLGVEGMMYLGAIFGLIAGIYAESAALTVLAAMAAGALGATIYAFLTVTLQANQNVTGLTLTIFGAGLANYIGDHLKAAGGATVAMLPETVRDAFRPELFGSLGEIPILGRLLFQYDPFAYASLLLAVGMGVYLNRTRVGRNLRAIGENPSAADASGVGISRYKYAHIALGGALCGLGGAYVCVVTCGGIWTNNCVNGLGWIAVALVIFAGWSPYRAVAGSVVFGALSLLRLRIPASVMRIPPAIGSMLPFLVTAAVLVITSMRPGARRQPPKHCGLNYDREER